MILRDKIEIIEGDPPVVVATLAAQVDYRSTSVDTGSGRFKVTEQLVAIVSRFDFDHTTQRIRWRGRSYGPDGSERTVTANGRIHHVEVPLIYVTG